MKKLVNKWNNINLVKRIIMGLVTGITFALIVVCNFRSLFVGDLKAVAPILVFLLVMAAI